MSVSLRDKLYLPGLNGIRAVAALSVLFGHMWSPFGGWGIGKPPFQIPWPSGPVTTFFVISGFLITYLLMNEIGKTNDVSIGKFYMRRILRIWPLYYGYMILAMIAAYLTFIAFWVQKQANDAQRQDIKVERFNSNFYNLLNIHEQITSSLEYSTYEILNGKYEYITYRGRDVFQRAFLTTEEFDRKGDYVGR